MVAKLSHFYASFLILLIIPFFIAQSRILQSSQHFPNFLQYLEGSQKGETVIGLKEVKKYLKRFGYYPNDQNDINFSDDFDGILENALKTYQKAYGLKVTGNLDSDTIKLINTPRCGVSDQNFIKHAGNESSRLIHLGAKYVLGDRVWPPDKLRLTYNFNSTAPTIDIIYMKTAIGAAFYSWSSSSLFHFEEVPDGTPADLVLGFHKGPHGDNAPFDGRFNVFAHAAPPTEGKCHFDAEESWSTATPTDAADLDLESVALHEIGHLLGLGHSTDKNAVMYAYFNYGVIHRSLGQDDVDGIRALYPI